MLKRAEVRSGSWGVLDLGMLKLYPSVGSCAEGSWYAPSGCRAFVHRRNRIDVKKSGVTLPILFTSLIVPLSSNPVCVAFVSFLLHSPKEEPIPARLYNLPSSSPKPQTTPITLNQPTSVCTRPRLTN